jgi:hypothetical protein
VWDRLTSPETIRIQAGMRFRRVVSFLTDPLMG